jgi:hypothetical protein
MRTLLIIRDRRLLLVQTKMSLPTRIELFLLVQMTTESLKTVINSLIDLRELTHHLMTTLTTIRARRFRLVQTRTSLLFYMTRREILLLVQMTTKSLKTEIKSLIDLRETTHHPMMTLTTTRTRRRLLVQTRTLLPTRIELFPLVQMTTESLKTVIKSLIDLRETTHHLMKTLETRPDLLMITRFQESLTTSNSLRENLVRCTILHLTRKRAQTLPIQACYLMRGSSHSVVSRRESHS